jgi:hypothetical protein
MNCRPMQSMAPRSRGSIRGHTHYGRCRPRIPRAAPRDFRFSDHTVSVAHEECSTRATYLGNAVAMIELAGLGEEICKD